MTSEQILSLLTFNPFWDASETPTTIKSMSFLASTFQSLLGCFYNVNFWDCYQLLFIFQSLLGCFSRRSVKNLTFVITSFNPFWDASKLVFENKSLQISYFQSLLGCFDIRYNRGEKMSQEETFNPFWDASLLEKRKL